MEYFLIIVIIILLFVGIIGCIIPVIPGPILNYCALLIVHFALPEKTFSLTFLIAFAVITVIVSLLDNIIPILGAQLYGASRYGIWCAVGGMIIGILFFPPFGMIDRHFPELP